MAALKKIPLWLISLLIISLPMLIHILSMWHALPLAPGETIGPEDPDPWLRLTLVRDWLSGGSWYDHVVHRSNAPFGGIASPWTRPLDVLIALLVKLQPVDVDLNLRLIRAAMLLPWIWMSLLLLGIYRAIRMVSDVPAAPLMASALVATAAVIWNYFNFANADHHALLAVLFIWAMGGVLHAEPSPRLTSFSGVLLGLLLWVSPEGLVLIGAMYAWYGLQWMAGERGFRPLLLLSFSILVTSIIAVCIERPRAEWLTPIYDSISIVYVYLLACCTLLACVLHCAQPRAISVRAAIAVACAASVVAALKFAYPLAMQGPMAGMDPYVFSHFLPRISEALPLFKNTPLLVLGMLVQPLAALALCWICFQRSDGVIARRDALCLAFFITVTLLLYVAQQRWYYYHYPLMVVMLAPCLGALFTPDALKLRGRWPASLLTGLSPNKQMGERLPAILLVIGLPLLLLYVAPSTKTALGKSIDACQLESRKLIYGRKLNELGGGKPLNVYIWTDLGAEMLFWTPHTIVASNYHREGAGIKYIWEMVNISDESELRETLYNRNINAILLCPMSGAADGSLLKKIYSGSVQYPWILEIKLNNPQTQHGPRVYAVHKTHTKLK